MAPILYLSLLFLAQDDAEGLDHFEKRIRPVLVAKCYSCHSLGSDKVKGGLLLDSREALLKGGNSGPVLVPGKPDHSLLLKAIRGSDDDLRMPPKGQLLQAHEVADFEAWIRRGAPDPRKSDARTLAPAARIDFKAARTFWSFRPLRGPVDSRETIDSFIDREIAKKGLAPTEPASKRALLRRVTYDLTGLPPTPAEIDAFLRDESPAAFANVVDRLLASPRYGERWGRHWLDLVRYADSAGDSSDFPIPQAGLYRDYVLRAFNQDKPYDQFLREQVAGDLLPSSTEAERQEKLIATGYLALARRIGIKPESAHHLTIEDTIDNLGRTVLGLTLSCARCHDHKFDPIPAEDYYGLYGIFQSTRFPYPGSETTKYQKEFVPLLPPGEAEAALRPRQERLAEWDAEILRLETAKDPGLKKARKDRDAFCMQPLPIETAYAVSEGSSVDASIHIKGDPDKPGREVPRHFLQVLGGQTVTHGSGRAELAEWLADPANPLTARVMVNRIWQHHFGRGLVRTPSDFGKQGQAPSHPELLDYLARRFIASGWSVKSMQRLILLSSTYQRASAGRPENLAHDPDSLTFWRFPRRRLEAEELRDTLLTLAGDLDLSPAGPHPFPASPQWDYSQARPFTADYSAFEHSRRTVFWMTQRLRKRPFMEIFDGPDPGATTPLRPTSTTPLQALYLMNDRFPQEKARRWAAKLMAEGSGESRRIDSAFVQAFARPPTSDERREAERFLGTNPSLESWGSLCHALLASNEFMFIE